MVNATKVLSSHQIRHKSGRFLLRTVRLMCVCLMCVCSFLPWAVQRLCDYVCDLLLEESNVQPVSTPVTVCGDIHGQVGQLVKAHLVFT